MGELSGDPNTSLFSPGIDVSKEGPEAIVTRKNGHITFYIIHMSTTEDVMLQSVNM